MSNVIIKLNLFLLDHLSLISAYSVTGQADLFVFAVHTSRPVSPSSAMRLECVGRQTDCLFSLFIHRRVVLAVLTVGPCAPLASLFSLYIVGLQDEVGPSTCLLLFKHIVDLQVLYPDKITIIYLENSKATHTCRSRCVTDRRVCFRCSYIAVICKKCGQGPPVCSRCNDN